MNTHKQEFDNGIEIEKETAQDRALATKIANSHLADDPQHYSKLKAAGLDNNHEDDVIKLQPGMHYTKMDSSNLGHDVDTPKMTDVNVGDSSKGGNNSVEFGKTVPKVPAAIRPSGKNHVSIDKGTVPFDSKTKTLCNTPPMPGQQKSSGPADATDHFIGQIASISIG